MSTREPDDEDVLAGLEEQLADLVLDPGDTTNVRELSPKDLLARFAAVERKLREMAELMVPRTQEGRDLHSQRAAYLVELRRRKMR